MNTMKTMQEILDLALESALYISREEYNLLELPLDDNHSYYMCDVLGTICSDELITREEHDFATGEITKYISGEKIASCMSLFLQKHSLPSSHEDKIKIYKNWDLRPKKLGWIVENDNLKRFLDS